MEWTQDKKPYYDYIIHLKQYVMKSRRCVSLLSSTEIKKQRPHATVRCSANQLITLQIWGEKKAAELKVQFAAARMGQTVSTSLFSTAVCHTSTRILPHGVRKNTTVSFYTAITKCNHKIQIIILGSQGWHNNSCSGRQIVIRCCLLWRITSWQFSHSEMCMMSTL